MHYDHDQLRALLCASDCIALLCAIDCIALLCASDCIAQSVVAQLDPKSTGWVTVESLASYFVSE